MASAGQLLSWARSNIGYRENGSNHTKFHSIAKRPQGWAWCGIFLEAAARETGLDLPGPLYYTPNAYAAYKRVGRVGQVPRVGAFAFVYYPHLGRIGHIGVVEAVNRDGTVSTIEGNTSTTGSRTGVGVFRQRRRARVTWDGKHQGIVAYAYPAYSSTDDSEDDLPSVNEVRDAILGYTPSDYSGKPGTTFGSAVFQAGLLYERAPRMLADLEIRIVQRLEALDKRLTEIEAKHGTGTK